MKSFTRYFVLAAASLSLAHTAQAGAELDGYCPAAYLLAGKAVKGSQEFSATHDGKEYYLANEDVLKAFQADPDKFIPQYAGFCAYGMSLGKKFESDPTVFSIIDGKVYLNKNDSVAKLFAKGTAAHIVKADANWKPMAMAAEKEAMMMKKEAAKK